LRPPSFQESSSSWEEQQRVLYSSPATATVSFIHISTCTEGQSGELEADRCGLLPFSFLPSLSLPSLSFLRFHCYKSRIRSEFRLHSYHASHDIERDLFFSRAHQSRTLQADLPAPPFPPQILFCVNSMLAWLMRTDIAIKQIEKLSWDWVKMDCTGGKCYGLLAVSRRSPRLPLPSLSKLTFSSLISLFCL